MKLLTETQWIERIQQDWISIKDCEDQTEAICLAAIQKNPMMLKYVKKPTEYLSFEAIRLNPYAFEYAILNDRIQLEIMKGDIWLANLMDKDEFCLQLCWEATYLGLSFESIEDWMDDEFVWWQYLNSFISISMMGLDEDEVKARLPKLFHFFKEQKFYANVNSLLYSIKEEEVYRKFRYQIRNNQAIKCISPYHILDWLVEIGEFKGF